MSSSAGQNLSVPLTALGERLARRALSLMCLLWAVLPWHWLTTPPASPAMSMRGSCRTESSWKRPGESRTPWDCLPGG
jgi:hypothetical protein